MKKKGIISYEIDGDPDEIDDFDDKKIKNNNAVN